MQRRTGRRGSRGRDRGDLRTASSVSCDSAASASSAVERSSTAWRRNPSIGSRAARVPVSAASRVEIAANAVIEFPAGLIGLGGTRFALVSADTDGAFHWLHSLEDASLALPVTNPWLFFADYEVELSDADTARVASETPDVWVTVRTGAAPRTSVRTSARRSWLQTAAAIR